MTVSFLNRNLDQELAAIARGASLECLVCGEFVMRRGSAIFCPECGSELAEEAAEALQFAAAGALVARTS